MKVSIIKEMDPYKQLWASVLMDAYRSLVWGKIHLRMPMGKNDTQSLFERLGVYFTSQAEVIEDQEWFLSEDTEPGSFVWICRVLSHDSPIRFDPDHIVLALRKRGLIS